MTKPMKEVESMDTTRYSKGRRTGTAICGTKESFHITSRRQPSHTCFLPPYLAFYGSSTISPPLKLNSRESFVSTHRPYFYRRAHKRCLSSSARFMIMVTHPNQSSTTIPNAVREGNTLVVGGGPTGLLAAIFMAQRNIPITVVEQDDENSRFDPSRAYTIWLSERGRRILQRVPELLQSIEESCVLFKKQLVVMCNADGSFSTFRNLAVPSDGGDYISATRIALVEGLQSYARRLGNVKLLKKTKVTNVVYDLKGEMEVFLNSEGKEYSIRTRLVLACDGRNSLLSESMRSSSQINDGLFRSSNGLGEDSVPTVTSGRLVKCIALKDNYNIREPKFQEDLTDFTTYRRFLPRKGLPFDERDTWAGVFDMPKVMRDRFGGVMALVSYLPQQKMRYLKTVEEGYSLFQNILPQLNARSCITPESMKRFIEAKPVKFPNSSRVESLVVHVGASPSAGVVFLGDAAHSFPPDSGQGVNAAFEDVLVLMQVLDGMEANASIEDILQEYEKEREEDLRALTTIVRRIAMSSGTFSLGLALRILNRKVRGILAKQFPGVFYPGLSDCIAGNYPYRDALRFQALTTTRLLASGASIPLIAILGSLALRVMKLGFFGVS